VDTKAQEDFRLIKLNMIKLLKEHNRLKEVLFLGAVCIICFSLSLFRYVVTESRMFLFLNWNLFLASIPWMISTSIAIRPKLQKIKLLVFSLIALWLLFFPNAPYIITDLFHLSAKNVMPLWFDLMLILLFAWTGLLFGFLSLLDMERVFAEKLPRKIIPSISAALLFIGSFGVYLGRYLRWNSWDVIREPLKLLNDVSSRLLSPLNYPRTWGMTLLMGLFLNVMYWSFKLIANRTSHCARMP
jgi:uncharacterized membrane protein